MSHSTNRRKASSAILAISISAGISIADTIVICALTGFSIPVAGAVGIGIGIFLLSFTALACCRSASKADEALGYK